MARDHPNSSLEALARNFLRFAEQEAEPAFSPLYARLCRGIASDPKVLALAADAPPASRLPTCCWGPSTISC